jgi:type II secretory pathway pseudopilin PulG
MSIVDLRGIVRPRRDTGFTIIEAVIVTVITALMTLVIERTVSGVVDTERTMRAVRNTTERGQQLTDRVRDLVCMSRKLYQNDAIGNAYLAKLSRTRFTPLAGARLPLVDEVNPMGPDVAGTPQTGNCLLFLREGDPYRAVADKPTKKIRSIDTYRLVCIYLAQSTKTVVAGGLQAVELVEWRSDAYPNYTQVSGIASATEKTAVVKDLYARFGVDYLWDPTGSVASSFYAIDGSGNIAASPTAVASIPEDLNVSFGGRLVSGNMAIARTDTTSKVRMPMFTADAVATWTPNGFEVKVTGPSGARQVWIHVTVEQQAAKGRVPAQTTTAVANTRDL